MAQYRVKKKNYRLLQLKIWGRSLSIYTTVAYSSPNIPIREQLQEFIKRAGKKNHLWYKGYKELMTERKQRADKGSFQLKARDVQVLTWVGQMYAVRFDILRRLLSREIDQEQRERAYKYHTTKAQEEGRELEVPEENLLAESTVYLVLRRWKNAGLVETAQVVGGEPIYIWLTQRGIDTVGLPFRAVNPSLSLIKHIHAVTKVRLRLEELHPDGIWTSERELTRRINRLKEEERKKIDHIPDGELDLPDNKKFVIEVELSQKTDQRISSIMFNLRKRYEMQFNKNIVIYYFVTDATRSAIERLGLTSLLSGQAPYFTKEELRVLSLKGGYS